MCARHTLYTISPSPDSTLAVEINETGLIKRKHLFIFERFIGRLTYNPDLPLETVLSLKIDAGSVLCKSSHEGPGTREKLTTFARTQALAAGAHPELQIESQYFLAKPLRGFTVEGTSQFKGMQRELKANIGFGVEKNGRLQIDADAIVRLSCFGIAQHTSLFGLNRTSDEAVLHALIWGTAAT